MNHLDAIDPRVLGRRLTEARKARGLTQQAAADHLGCSRPTFTGIEKGTRRPTPEELVKLAGLYGRTLHELLRPGTPTADFEPHLRAVVDPARCAGPDVDAAITELRRFAEDYCELEHLAGAEPLEQFPAEVPLPTRGRIDDYAEDVAARERVRLQLGDQPARDLQNVLELSTGVRIFFAPLSSRIAGMYAHAGELGYCILINSRHPAARRRWSLAHEWGHFLCDRHRPGIDYLESGDRLPANERFADRFAAAFLMPSSGVRRQFYDVTRTTHDFQVADLCRMAAFYHVSVPALTLRLESLRLIPRGTWDDIKKQGFRAEAARGALGLPSPDARSEPYSRRYKYLAVELFVKGELSEGQLARFLRVHRVRAREIVEECSLQSDVAADGAELRFTLPFEQSVMNAGST
jgi:Zn-dependent peptidase ImmA (M78 family)/DNA-binding XRE family transcriptional regulator